MTAHDSRTADYLAALLRATEGLVSGSETYYGYPNLLSAWNTARDHLIEINYNKMGFRRTAPNAGNETDATTHKGNEGKRLSVPERTDGASS